MPVVIIGTVLWAAALLLTVLLRDPLADRGYGDWVWVSLAGVGLGLLGIWHLRRRRGAQARREAQARPAAGDPPARPAGPDQS